MILFPCVIISSWSRFLFAPSQDILWFQPVQLRTKHGLVGEIREPLGTKGHFKCSFNDFIKQNDTVCMHLYKRQHPKWDDERDGAF